MGAMVDDGEFNVDPLVEPHGEDDTADSKQVDHANQQQLVLHHPIFIEVLVLKQQDLTTVAPTHSVF